MHTPETEKLHKVLARAGFGSRRELESWIAQGRVSINGKVATLGDRVSEKDVIRVDGNVVPREKVSGGRRRVLMYHKPVGEVTTRSDPEGRPTVFDHLPNLRNGRWVAVGRLDFNTAGRRMGPSLFERHLQTGIQVVLVALIIWFGQSTLDVKDKVARLEEQIRSVQRDLSSANADRYTSQQASRDFESLTGRITTLE